MSDSLERYSRDATAARLKEARQRKFSTAAELARAVGMKDVTVRAHENGQNGLSDAIAKKYAKVLGVSPEWILYGVDDDIDNEEIKDHVLSRRMSELMGHTAASERMPVWQSLREGTFSALPPQSLSFASGFLTFQLPRYEGVKASAFQISDDHASDCYEQGRFVIIGPPWSIDVREGDHVVVAKMLPKSNICETTVRGIRFTDSEIELISLMRGRNGEVVDTIDFTRALEASRDSAKVNLLGTFIQDVKEAIFSPYDASDRLETEVAFLERVMRIVRARKVAQKDPDSAAEYLPTILPRNDQLDPVVFVLGVVIADFKPRERTGASVGRWLRHWEQLVPASE